MGMIEHYYKFLQRVYFIIITEIPKIQHNLALQIFSKAINNLVGPNQLVFTLLVFGVYSQMIKQDAPSPSIIQRAVTMQKIIDEVRKYIAF